MASHIVRRAAHALFLVCAMNLSGCDLWPTDGTTSTPASPAAPTGSGTISGTVAVSTTGAPLNGVTVKAAGLSTSTGADGSYTLPNVPAGDGKVVSFEVNGYAKGVFTVSVPASGAARASARLTPVGATQSFDAASAATVGVPGSVAQVALPAAGLVTASGAAASGAVKVEVTAIDPAADPANMPGNYTAQLTGGATGRIESFGAIKVTLTDATGARLNLASGKTATIRIPLSTRSSSPPASVPLYYLNESNGLWSQEGSATLAGTAPNQYYEGTVSHFTYWNADQPTETIQVRGCVQDDKGVPVADADVKSEGSNYSGTGYAVTDSKGNFTVAMRKGSVANIFAEQGSRVSNAVRVGPSDVDVVLPACLVFPAVGTGVPPTIIKQPESMTTFPGGYAFLRVEAVGSPILTYQWKRNGVAVQGATQAAFYVPDVAAGDSGASFTVTVSNSFGSVTSDAAVLTVDTTPQAPSIIGQPLPRTVSLGATATFDVLAQSKGGTLTYGWRRNGTPIAGATASSYTTPATTAGDSGAVYTVVVSSSNGTSVTSGGAVLTVVVPTPLTISAQPVNVSLNVGQSASFSVTAAGGSGALTYQWQRNGSPIAGATSVSYTTPATTLADSGSSFSVVVSSGSESVTSSAATLTVSLPVGANGYYLIAPAGPRVAGSTTFANGPQATQTQAIVAVNATSPRTGNAITIEPAGQAAPLFVGALEGTIAGNQVSKLRTRFAGYMKGGRLYRVDQVVADGSVPTPQLMSSLTAAELCGSVTGVPTQSFSAQGSDLVNASRSWVFFEAPGPDGQCDTADDTYRAVRFDMTGTDAARSIAEPQVDVLNADGSFGGLIVRNGTQIQKLDATLSNATDLFTIATSGYSNQGLSFGASAPGIWLFVEGGQLWGVNLVNPGTRVSLATLGSGEVVGNIVSDGASAYVALNTNFASSRVLRVTDALAASTLTTLNLAVQEMAVTPTRLVLLSGGSSATLRSIPKAGGSLTLISTLPAGANTSQFFASGENVYLGVSQFGATGSTVSTLIISASGSNAETLNGTTPIRPLAPAVQAINFGLESIYAVVLADNVTSAISYAGATVRVVEGATRTTLLTYGSLPTTPDGVLTIGGADPLQYGQPGLLSFFGVGGAVANDLFFYQSDAAGLIQVTNFGTATPTAGKGARAQAAAAPKVQFIGAGIRRRAMLVSPRSAAR